MTSFPAAVGRAMATQVKRTRRDQTPQDIIDELRAMLTKVERERDAALAEVKRLNTENDDLHRKAYRAGRDRKVATADGSATGKFHDGIEYINQSEAAEILNVPQFKISRWVKAKKFEMIAVPGLKVKQIVRSSLYKPEPGKAGRKKK